MYHSDKKNTQSNKFVSSPSIESFGKLLDRAREKDELKDETVGDFVKRTKDLTAEDLFQH